MNKLTSKTQCAGFNCPERNDCLRYVRRVGDEWASLDVERFLKDSCPAKIEIERQTTRKARKAA